MLAVGCQAPLSTGFSRQEYWSGLPVPSPRDLPDPGIESGSPASQADSLPSEPPYFACYIYIGICMLSHFNHAWLFVIIWTVACQAPLFMGFSRQEYWSGVPFLLQGNPPDLGIELTPLISPVSAGRFFTTSITWEAAPLYLWFFCICWFNQPQIVYYYSIYYRRKKKPLRIHKVQTRIVQGLTVLL